MTNGNFPERLRDAMDRRRITGRELAAGAGTTEATVSRYLSGARSPENFEILKHQWQQNLIASRQAAKELGVSQDTFLRWAHGK